MRGCHLLLPFFCAGTANIVGAIKSAAEGIFQVCVFFHGKLFQGNRVVKKSSEHFDGFGVLKGNESNDCIGFIRWDQLVVNASRKLSIANALA